MEWKSYAIKCMSVSFGLLIMVMLLVALIDPFFVYHMPLFNKKAVQEKSIYQNPGIASNDEYDTIITGSSVTENFRVTWFNEIYDCDAIKLPVGSGRTVNYAGIFEKAFSSSNDIKRVFWGLDVFCLVCDAEETIQEMPYYLYDENWLNDTSYFWNKDILSKEIPNTISKWNEFDEDEAYTWDHTFEFGEEIAIKHYMRYAYPAVTEQDMLPQDTYLQNCKENLNNFVEYIKNNQQTEFKIFFPPYSILYWHDKNRRGETEAWLFAEQYAIEVLLEYENVKLFFPQNQEWIICDLNNYKDYVHYTSDINYYLAEMMNNEECVLTKENYIDEIEKLSKIINNYDYGKKLENYVR